MKILIQAQPLTYSTLKQKSFPFHISAYHNFLHYNVWKKQGYEVNFYGEKTFEDKVITSYKGYDTLFFRGYNSFKPSLEFVKKTLSKFNGRKILYLEGADKYGVGEYFDTVFIPEVETHYNWWKEKFPKKDVRRIPWTCPEFALLDKDESNPYKNNHFKLLYFGNIKQRYLKIIKKLAEKGEHIILGGMLSNPPAMCRGFMKNEIKNLHPNITLINKARGGLFTFGTQFSYLKFADLGLCFYPRKKEGSLISKMTEYLCCGLSVIGENSIPNRNRIIECNGGQIVEWDNFNELYDAIQKEKEVKRNKKEIMKKARGIYNPYKICEEILK